MARRTAKKQKVYICQTTTLQVHHAFLYFSLPSLHDYKVKLPNFTFSRGQEHKTTTFFSCLELWYRPLEFNSKKNANIWRIKIDGISAIKLEAAQIHFFQVRFLQSSPSLLLKLPNNIMSGQWPLAPYFCSRKTRESQLILFHKNHNLSNLDFTGWSPYNNIVFKDKLFFGGGGWGVGLWDSHNFWRDREHRFSDRY